MEEILNKQIETRLGSRHLRKRLKRQQSHSALQFKGGFKVYWENSDWIPPVLQFLLKRTRLLNRGFQNSINYEVIYNQVPMANLPDEFKDFTILHLSDIHIDGLYDHGLKLVETIKDLKYDLCVITGDFRYLTYGPSYEAVTYIKRFVEALNRKEPIIGILGNHDFINMVTPLEEIGIKMLINESTVIQKNDANLAIAGVDDPHFYGTADLDKASKDILSISHKILLAHSQELIEPAAVLGYNMYLCGHTHGGQICLPGGKAIIKNSPCSHHYISGAWNYYNLNGYTSRGVGASHLPVRFNCRPEVILHRLV